MSRPRSLEDVNAYLAEFNAALAVGLRSRSRILEEVGEHIYEAASAEHERLLTQMQRGELPVQPVEALWTAAQRHAIASFGRPEEVAAGFHAGPLGPVERRLALADARFEAALRRRPVLAGTLWAAATSLAWVAMGAAICVAGGLLDVGYAAKDNPALAIISVLVVCTITSVLAFCVRMWHVLRKLPAGGVATWRGLPLKQAPLALVAFRDWLGYIFFMGYVVLTHPMSFRGLMAAWIGLALVVELAARLARRSGHAGGWSVYGGDPDQNWSRYVSGLWTSVGITALLILVTASSWPLAGGMSLLLVVFATLTVLTRRLAWNSSVKRNWGRTYEQRAAAG